MAMTEELLASIDEFKLETEYQEGNIVQCYPTPISSDEIITPACFKKTWRRKEQCIAFGSFGSVWLEEAQEVKGQLRAVKEISKQYFQYVGIDYRREILAFAKLSEVFLR